MNQLTFNVKVDFFKTLVLSIHLIIIKVTKHTLTVFKLKNKHEALLLKDSPVTNCFGWFFL